MNRKPSRKATRKAREADPEWWSSAETELACLQADIDEATRIMAAARVQIAQNAKLGVPETGELEAIYTDAAAFRRYRLELEEALRRQMKDRASADTIPINMDALINQLLAD